jgi:hypothetical protein
LLKRFLKAAQVLRHAVDEGTLNVENIAREHIHLAESNTPITSREMEQVPDAALDRDKDSIAFRQPRRTTARDSRFFPRDLGLTLDWGSARGTPPGAIFLVFYGELLERAELTSIWHP